MIDPPSLPAVPPSGTRTTLRWGGGERSIGLGSTIGAVFLVWGAYAANVLLILGGAAVSVLAWYLGTHTQLAAFGRPFFQEEFIRHPDGSRSGYKLRLEMTNLEIFFHLCGFGLAILGVLRTPMSLFLIAAGLLIVWTTQLYGNWRWFQGTKVGPVDSLLAAYEKLTSVGSEVRGDGYVVRRVENGLRYIEGDRSLTLRSGLDFIEKERLPSPRGTTLRGDRLELRIGWLALSARKWDAPHNKESIPRAELFRICDRITAALNSTIVFHVHA